MRVACPSCSTLVDTDPGELAACSACGHWWLAEEPAPDEPTAPEGPAAPAEAQAEAGPPAPAATPQPDPDPVTEEVGLEELDAVSLQPVAESSEAAAPAPAAAAPAPAAPRAPSLAWADDLPDRLPTPELTPPDHPWEFELQFAVGDQVQGPFDRLHLREQLYTGRLTGDERIRVPGSTVWGRLGDREEFAVVLGMLGKEEGTRGHRRIAGWRSSGEAGQAPPPEAAAPTTGTGNQPRPAPAPAPSSGTGTGRAPAPAPPAKGGPPVVLIAVGVGALLGVAALVAFFFV